MVQARPTNRPLVGARLALSLGQRWLQEPQQFRESAGSLQVETPTFALTLVAVIGILTVLQFLPALVLGPIADHLTLAAH